MIDNANLVKKVAFPREILPLASVGVALVDFVLQTGVLLVFIVVIGSRHRRRGAGAVPARVRDARGVHDRDDALGRRR